MTINQIVQGLYAIPLGGVNAFLLELPDGLVLIDTGSRGADVQILQAVDELGYQPTDIKHILLTHWHADHIGSLAVLKRATGAQTYAHPLDAALIREGGIFDPTTANPRPFVPGPSLLTRLLFRLFIKPITGIEGTPIDHEINEGDTLSFLPDFKIVHAPGHSTGHIVLLWDTQGGVLFAADTCANIMRLSWSIGYEDLEEGKRTLKKLCEYDFQIATFGHGDAILEDAASKWRKRWSKLQA